MPAPSPVSGSAPAAPRWFRQQTAVSASSTMAWLLRPCTSTTKPTPHASCSNRGSYSGGSSRSATAASSSFRAVSSSWDLATAGRHWPVAEQDDSSGVDARFGERNSARYLLVRADLDSERLGEPGRETDQLVDAD